MCLFLTCSSLSVAPLSLTSSWYWQRTSGLLSKSNILMLAPCSFTMSKQQCSQPWSWSHSTQGQTHEIKTEATANWPREWSQASRPNIPGTYNVVHHCLHHHSAIVFRNFNSTNYFPHSTILWITNTCLGLDLWLYLRSNACHHLKKTESY